MSEFDFSTLITDRTNADVSALSTLLSKKLEAWTPEELEQFNNGVLKGGYCWTDLNRVTACMEYLDEELSGFGYETGYKPVVVHEQPEPLDPYTWYKEDSPTLSQMTQYLSNVAALRAVLNLPEYVPQTPKSMALLTFAKANDIESVLKEVENVIILIISSFWYSGELYSGEV